MSKVRHIDFSPKLSVRYVSGYSQWGYGYVQKIVLPELDENVEVHYSLNESGGTAVVVKPTVEDNVITVEVPNFLFAQESTIDYKAYAFIYTKGKKSGDTIKKIIMHVDSRPKPEDFVYTEDEHKSYESLKERIEKIENEGGSVSKEQVQEVVEEALQEAKESGEFDGEQGPPGVSGVYVGSGEMPEGFNVQIDQDGEADELVTREEFSQLQATVNDMKEDIENVGSPTDEQIESAVDKYLDENPIEVGETKPQWAEFPRLINPARDIYNSVSMVNKKVLGTDGTLRHNLMIHGELMTWTESTSGVDYADSSGSASVKLCGWYDMFGLSFKEENSNIVYTDALGVFPSGADIYGVDGTVIDTVVASSDSTIVDLGSGNYIIMAGCQGASSYHMVYREVSYKARGTMTLGDTINVLTIGGVEWDMTTLREDYFNKYSQLNTKVIKNGNYYYMAMVQSGVGIAIMKSSDGKEWSLHHHIPDTDCHLEACIGFVSWFSNNMPTVYVVVRHKYGDGYITLYGFKNINTMDLLTKTFIPASTGRALLDSVNNKDIYLAYSVNGRNNAVLAQILPNSDGTTGVSILETPREVMSNYPTLYTYRSGNGKYCIMFGGTDGLNKSGSSISCAYLWNENNDVLKEKNEQLKKVMFGTSVEVVQTLTEGTEIGSVGGTKLYAPKASSGGGGTPTLQLLGNATVTEDTGSVDFTFSEPLNLKKIMVYANTKAVADFTSQARGNVFVNDKNVADGMDNNSFKEGASKYMLFDIDIHSNGTIGRMYMQTAMGGGYSSEKVAFLTGTDINSNTNITKISFKANIFDSVAIASGTTVSVYGY